MKITASDAFHNPMLELIKRFQALDLSTTASESYYTNRAEAIANQLYEKEFRITVVGEFSAGKSTFLNALIGKDVLQHAVDETTATVTYIRNVPAGHPSADTIVVHYNDKQKSNVTLNMKENPAALKMYTTTKSDLDVVREISHVDVYVNFKNTDEKIVFIDTPGLNGVADGHRDLTLHEIKQAHASICLFHLRSLAHNNLEFLQILQKYQRSFLFVLNFIDEIRSSEGDTVEKKLQSFHEQLIANLINENGQEAVSIRTFGLSALKALAAKDITIPRLYSDDLIDLTVTDRERLMQESLFGLFEDCLWNDVLRGEKNQVYQTSVYRAFQTLLEELRDELSKAKEFSQVQLDEKEMDEIERRLFQLEELSQRNWDKLTHYMTSRQSDLDKLLKEKIAKDVEAILEQIREKVRLDDFETFELSMQQNAYSKLLQNHISVLSQEYHHYLSLILGEIYQTSIMRAKEYLPSVEISTEGALTIKAAQFDGSDYKFEKQLTHLQDKKIDYVVQRNRIVDEQESMTREIKQIDLKVKKTLDGISQATTSQTIEQNQLGREPDIRQYEETRYRTKERSNWNPLSWIGLSTYEEAYTVTVTDTSQRDQWHRNKEQLQTKYAKLKDSLQKESTELRLRKKQFETKAAQYTDMLNSLQTKLSQVEDDIKRKQIEYDEILLKARSEFLRSEKRRLLEQMERFLQEHVHYTLLESSKQNVEDNMASIRQQVRDFYDKNQAEARNKLTMMMESSKEVIQKQLVPYKALLDSIALLYLDLEHIKTVNTSI
ncbi:Bacterial dynamin-like protein [compost metagenome]